MRIDKIKRRVEKFQKTRESLMSGMDKKIRTFKDLVEYGERCS